MGDNSKLILQVPNELLRRIDEYWHKNMLPSRAVAIRQLLNKALDYTDTSSK